MMDESFINIVNLLERATDAIYQAYELLYELEVDVAAEEADETDKAFETFELLFGETYFCGFTGVPFVPEKHS